MSQVIRISSELYSRLKQHATGFDTPANVIEKLLNHVEGIAHKSSTAQPNVTPSTSRDKTKYCFNNQYYGKGRLVLAVVEKYVSNNSDTTFDELLKIFPKHIQGSTGVFNEYEYVINKYAGKNHKRHFLKPDEIIQLSNCVIAVCTEWGMVNIDDFIQRAESLGYTISPSND